MKKPKIHILLLLVAGSLLLSSCMGGGIPVLSWPGLIVDDEAVYVAYTTSVLAYRTSDGTMLWNYPTNKEAGRVFFAKPAVAGNKLIVGDFIHTINALDKTNGTELWSFAEAEGRFVAGPIVANGWIFAPSADGTLYALNQDGSLKWKFATENALWAQPVTDGEWNEETQIIEGATTVYQPSMDHKLYAIDIQSGQEKWDIDLGAALVFAPNRAEDGTLYIGTIANDVVAINASGKELGRFTAAGSIWTTPVLREGVVYFGDASGMVYALDARRMTQNWVLDIKSPILGEMALIPEGLVFVNKAGEITAIGYNGTQLWKQTVSGQLYTGPVATSEKILVLVSSSEKFLLMLGLNGTELRNIQPPAQ